MTAIPIVDEQNQLIVDEDGMVSFVMEDDSSTIKIPSQMIDRSAEFLLCNLGNKEVKLVLNNKNPEAIVPTQDQFVWNEAATKLFFASYFSSKQKGGKCFIHKRLFEAIASDMNSHGYAITALQVTNKYKSLERAFKTHVSTNKTGRGRRVLNFETEITEMFGKKHNIFPKVVSGRHGLITMASPPTATIPGSGSVDPGPSTSQSRAQNILEPNPEEPNEGMPSIQQLKIKKRDGKMAMALDALREEMARQIEAQKARDNALLEEMKKNNALKAEANAQRAERNNLIREQISLLKELLNKE